MAREVREVRSLVEGKGVDLLVTRLEKHARGHHGIVPNAHYEDI